MFNCVKRRCLVILVINIIVGVRLMVMIGGLGCLLELINLIKNMWRRRR
jgi:hypothetical protein